MENEIREQNRQHLEAVGKEQDQVKELLRRGAIRHYFLGPENLWSREGFGIVVGGLLTIFFGGYIFPQVILYANSSLDLNTVSWVMTAIGVVVLGKGLFEMIKESKKENIPVSDQTHDEILERDLEDLKKTSREFLIQNIPQLGQEEPIDEMEKILVKGPRDYVHNVNLPLEWKLGEDGILRYSNFSVMALYFGKEKLYIYTSIFNMRNGTSKFQHAYECPYQQIRFVGFSDKTVETVNQKNKSVVMNLKMFVIDAGENENDKLSMPVADYDILKKMGGTIDDKDAEEAIRMITDKINHLNQ